MVTTAWLNTVAAALWPFPIGDMVISVNRDPRTNPKMPQSFLWGPPNGAPKFRQPPHDYAGTSKMSGDLGFSL